MNEVTLRIIGTQHSSDGEENTIEMMTCGKQYEKSGCTFLVYDESEISGMEGSTTTLKVEDDKVMMKRFGTNESKLEFESGVKHRVTYKTIYGNMDMEVVTSKIDIERDESGVRKIDLSYKLCVAKEEMKNHLSISIL